MYTTCIFCNGSLGRNEALENFQVGRRLAYDLAKGRLWVVCRKCERWNLTPLEIRWEAIEEAERAFRETRLRVSTDNIGLAQLNEGLELVRVGTPPKLELAGWRYGDQFGRRRRKHIAIGVGLTMATVGAFAVGVTSFLWAGAGASALMELFNIATQEKYKRDATIPKAWVRDNKDGLLYLSTYNLRAVAVVPVRGTADWYIKVPHLHIEKGSGYRVVLGKHAANRNTFRSAEIKGEVALRAMATILPYVNLTNGSGKNVREAVSMIEASSNVNNLVRLASLERLYNNDMPGENLLRALPPRMGLALEMVLHEEDERRALEGELAALEQRWKEAEEIAGIADSMFLPEGIDDRLEELRKRAARDSERTLPKSHGKTVDRGLSNHSSNP